MEKKDFISIMKAALKAQKDVTVECARDLNESMKCTLSKATKTVTDACTRVGVNVTKALTKEHDKTRTHVSSEHKKTREHISREHSATREHISREADRIIDSVDGRTTATQWIVSIIALLISGLGGWFYAKAQVAASISPFVKVSGYAKKTIDGVVMATPTYEVNQLAVWAAVLIAAIVGFGLVWLIMLNINKRRG